MSRAEILKEIERATYLVVEAERVFNKLDAEHKRAAEAVKDARDGRADAVTKLFNDIREELRRSK